MIFRVSQEHGKEIALIKREMATLESLPSFNHALLLKGTTAVTTKNILEEDKPETTADAIIMQSNDDGSDDGDDDFGGLGLFDAPPAGEAPAVQSSAVVTVHEFDFKSGKGVSVVTVLAEWCRKNVGATIGLAGK